MMVTTTSEGTEATGETTDTTGTDAEPNAPRIYYFGRHDASDPDRVRYGWSGSGFRVRFRGTGAHVTLDDAAEYHTIIVDGAVHDVLHTTTGEQRYTLVEGLAEGEHEVELHRRTEGSFGVTEVLAVEVDGELLAPTLPERFIEVVGDSITCGYGNEGADETCSFSAETENHYAAYATIAARAMQAELSTVAWSGKGVLYNYGNDKNQPMPTLYPRTLPGSREPVWTGGPSAGVVVVNLGTNDYSTDDDPEQGDFVEAYVGLLEAIRENHPAAMIFTTVAPLLSGADRRTAEEGIDAAIAARAAAGDVQIQRIDLYTPAQGHGCDWHPSLATHQAMAELLIPHLQQAFGI